MKRYFHLRAHLIIIIIIFWLCECSVEWRRPNTPLFGTFSTTISNRSLVVFFVSYFTLPHRCKRASTRLYLIAGKGAQGGELRTFINCGREDEDPPSPLSRKNLFSLFFSDDFSISLEKRNFYNKDEKENKILNLKIDICGNPLISSYLVCYVKCCKLWKKYNTDTKQQ